MLAAAAAGGGRLHVAAAAERGVGGPMTERIAGIRRRIEVETGSGRATGIAVALTQGPRILWAEGFGWADRERHIKATENTPFCLASVTKPFTTTTMMTLVSDGRMSLDDSFAEHLGIRRQPDGSEYPHNASIGLLGAHAAGFPSLFEMYPVRGSRQPPSTEELLARYGTLVYPAGEVYEYSNIGYAVLGEIAERCLGQPFGKILHDRILQPLRLNDSYFGSRPEGRGSCAVLYDELNQRIPRYSTATPASGELHASAHDVAQFALFNMKNRLPHHAPILDDGHIDELHRPIFHGSTDGAATFGWFTGRTKTGLRIIYKDGGQPGVSTIVYMVPSENVSGVVLANRTDNGTLVQEVADEMMSCVLPDWSTPDVSVSTPKSTLAGSVQYRGRWRGVLRSGAAVTPIVLDVAGDTDCTLSLSGYPQTALTNVVLRGGAMVGSATGSVDAVDPTITGATSLALKLRPQHGSLAGRILATAESAGTLTSLPYPVTLRRV